MALCVDRGNGDDGLGDTRSKPLDLIGDAALPGRHWLCVTGNTGDLLLNRHLDQAILMYHQI